MKTRIKYEAIINNNITDLLSERDKLIKLRGDLEPEYRRAITVDINKKMSSIDKKINDLQSELSMIKENTVDGLENLLNIKEKECVYLAEVYNRVNAVNGVSSSEFINGSLLAVGVIVQDQKNKSLLDIDLLKEDVCRLVLIESLNINFYDIDNVFISDKDKDESKEYRSKEGFFFIFVDDKNVLVLVKEACDDISELDIEYVNKIDYKDKIVYMDIKNNIAIENRPFYSRINPKAE